MKVETNIDSKKNQNVDWPKKHHLFISPPVIILKSKYIFHVKRFNLYISRVQNGTSELVYSSIRFIYKCM